MGKRIVILGAGFGGLHTAIILGRKAGQTNEVILIDRNSHHTFTPLLYEVATTPKEVANYIELHEITTYEISNIFKGLPVRFIQSDISKVDIMNGDIHLASGEKIKYDYLVVAIGSEPNFFNIPNIRENSFQFKTFKDALRIRDAVWDLVSQGQSPKIVVGGGGSTGVELAAELQHWLYYIKREKKDCEGQVTLIDGGPTILNGFSKTVIDKVTRRLTKLGVCVLNGSPINSVSNNKVVLKNGQEIKFDLFIWSGGVKANSLMQSNPLKFEEKGRSGVTPNMTCLPFDPKLKLYGKVYGIGDIVCAYSENGLPVPMVARAAISQGTVAAKNILEELKGKNPTHIYKPINYPYIIPVGGKYAVAKIGPIVFSGFLGWLVKGLIELGYLFSLIPTGKALKVWVRGLKIFIQNDRLG